MKTTKIIVLDKFRQTTDEERRSLVINNIVKFCISECSRQTKDTEQTE